MRRPTANRDQAVILTLLDSCVRASEFCAFRIGDFDSKRGKLEIRHGSEGGAKGGKGRTVYLGKTARHALWRYLAEREDGEEPNAPLFVVGEGRPFNPSSLRHIIKSIALRAGVKDAHPHRFRHTGAITYLRSGGDMFTLQSLLGHGSLEMVRHYARIAPFPVVNARGLAQHLSMLVEGERTIWSPQHLAEFVPASSPLAIYGRGPAWLASAVAAHALPETMLSSMPAMDTAIHLPFVFNRAAQTWMWAFYLFRKRIYGSMSNSKVESVSRARLSSSQFQPQVELV